MPNGIYEAWNDLNWTEFEFGYLVKGKIENFSSTAEKWTEFKLIWTDVGWVFIFFKNTLFSLRAVFGAPSFNKPKPSSLQPGFPYFFRPFPRVLDIVFNLIEEE